MLSTPHIMIGAAIVKLIPNPIISIPLAFLIHFLFDAIPHWDFSVSFTPKSLFKVFIDYSIGIGLIFFLSLGDKNQLIIIFGGIAATAPDIILGSWKVLGFQFLNVAPLNTMNSFHTEIQKRIPVFWGLGLSVVAIIITAWILVQS